MRVPRAVTNCASSENNEAYASTSPRSQASRRRIITSRTASSGWSADIALIDSIATRLLLEGPCHPRLVDRVVDAGVLHLLPGLLAPMDFDHRIGIPLVVGGIVVVRDGFETRPFGHCQRLREDVI